jgi:PiT family inorganic phosphate transporter
MSSLSLAGLAIALALFFNFSNGFHDAANIVATVISSRAMSVGRALIMTAVLVFCGSMLLGTAVAETIGSAIIDTGAIDIATILAAMTAAIVWNLLTWYWALPSSSSHALIGGLIGAALASAGPSAVHWFKLLVIIAVILVAPMLGLLSSFLITRLNFAAFKDMNPNRGHRLQLRLQIAASALLALAHGSNDAQKAMGLITLSLILLYRQDPAAIGQIYIPLSTFTVPSWAVLGSSLAISLGMLSGGTRIIRTVGLKLYKIRPQHGFGAQLASTLTVYACAALGFPVSTTQIASSSIMGAGAAQRLGIVRWGIAGEIALGWLVTLPAAGLLAYLCAISLRLLN